MPETKGSILRFSLAFALGNVRVGRMGPRRQKIPLTEDERYQVAEDAIRELRKYGGWQDLDDPVEPNHQSPGWIDGKPP